MTKVGDNDPTTRTYTITEEMLADLQDIGFGAMIGYILIISWHFEFNGMACDPGLYVKKLESTSNGVVSTTYPSKIEFAQQDDPVMVPFSKLLLPRDIHSGPTVELDYITLKSTTSGSTKKFKITVDDSGALKATEVES